ncbi:MAG: phytanoyl-CoA dioxygenase family protein [Verrucomicrobia bacterium]|nr:phytanoyl-CoA dioxygenase family protein [Verrucomicrobiota bacterium]MCH8511915.1 phytanoyl-CoA dioxygenase family protein [Kiritimatiellia bacterium]
MNEVQSLKHEFETNGYVVLESLLTPDEVTEAREAIQSCVARTAAHPGKRQGGGKEPVTLHSASSDFFFQLEPGVDPGQEPSETLEFKVRKLMNFDREHAAFSSIAHGHPRLGPALEALLGPDPVLFQSMALIKPPHIGSEKPWHQDNAYFNVTPLDAVVGVWIALDAATVANGCMHVIPGGHRMGALRHHHDKDCEIMEGRLDPSHAVAVELPPGGALLFYGMLPHQTPPNRSPDRRRALQFHYHAATAVRIPTKDYDRLYAEADGTPASCEAARQQGI